MQILYVRCCGLDVHKQRVSACLFVAEPGHRRQKTVRTFGTTTQELVALHDWLQASGCTHVAMESTGSYWKPIYNQLEDTFELIVANPQHIKALPGRKTDVGDAEWIADLLQHGLIRASFIPSRQVRELRELTRYRKVLIQERAAEVNRIQKVLEGANIKLASVITNVLGVSGRAMLDAVVAGTTDVEVLADLAHGRMQKKRSALQHALTGTISAHQRFIYQQQLEHIDRLDAAIEQCGEEIRQRLDPQGDQIKRLCSIPGVGRRVAETILAEIGADMSRFPSAKHLASWAGVCPGNRESGGKRKSGKTRKGSRWLREALVEAARAAARTRNTYLAAQYHRIAARRGGNRAAMAVAHTILVIAYHLLQDQTTYEELGATYFDTLNQEQVQRRLVKRLAAMGYQVTIEPRARAQA